MDSNMSEDKQGGETTYVQSITRKPGTADELALQLWMQLCINDPD